MKIKNNTKITISILSVIMLLLSTNALALNNKSDVTKNDYDEKFILDFNEHMEKEKTILYNHQKTQTSKNNEIIDIKFEKGTIDKEKQGYSSTGGVQSQWLDPFKDIDETEEKTNIQTTNIKTNSETTEPPWDDNWDDTITQGDGNPPVCKKVAQATSNPNDGSGYVQASRGVGGSTHCEAWFGFKGHWTSPVDDTLDVILQITYNGVVSVGNIPPRVGDSSMEIGSKVEYAFTGENSKETILWQRDTWDDGGTWTYGDTIGLIFNDVSLTEGTVYEFSVEFHVCIDITTTLLEKIDGSIGIDYGSFDEALFYFTPKPDLYVNEYMLWSDPEPGMFWPGDEVSLLGTIVNLGNANSGPFTVVVKFDNQIIETFEISNLDMFDHIDLETQDITWPSDTDLHKVEWIADYDNEVDEIYEDNSASIWLRAREPPDMTVTEVFATDIDGVIVDENINQGDPIIFWANISNLGDAAGPFWIYMYMDDGDTPFATGLIPGVGSHSQGFAYTGTAWSWEGYEHKITWVVDAEDDLVEINEDNNELSEMIGPTSDIDLYIDNIWIEPENEEFNPGDEIVEITAEIKNSGGGYVGEFDIGIKIDSGDWQDLHIDGVAPGYYIEANIKFTDGWPDENCHTFHFRADRNGDIEETNEDNNDKSAEFCPNVKPKKPSRPSGPGSIRKEETYDYTSSTTDPNGDDIKYKFDWGDGTNSGWLGPKDSGETITASHKWTEKGDYNVKVKTKDAHGLESDWSEPTAVEVTKEKNLVKYNSRFFNNFDFLYKLVQKVFILLNK